VNKVTIGQGGLILISETGECRQVYWQCNSEQWAV